MFFVQALFALGAAALAAAESHTIHFDNACGYGTPVIYQNFQQVASGDHTFNGPASSVIAFLQTGNCGANGENCSMVEFTLVNGGVSSTDVTLIPPHTFSVPTGFGYYNGCDGVGNNCASANCGDGAFHKTDDYAAQRQCTANDVNLAITFCK